MAAQNSTALPVTSQAVPSVTVTKILTLHYAVRVQTQDTNRLLHIPPHNPHSILFCVSYHIRITTYLSYKKMLLVSVAV